MKSSRGGSASPSIATKAFPGPRSNPRSTLRLARSRAISTTIVSILGFYQMNLQVGDLRAGALRVDCIYALAFLLKALTDASMISSQVFMISYHELKICESDTI